MEELINIASSIFLLYQKYYVWIGSFWKGACKSIVIMLRGPAAEKKFYFVSMAVVCNVLCIACASAKTVL